MEVCFVLVETAAPTLKSDGAQKNYGFLLLWVKLHIKFERTRLLKDGKSKFEIEWNSTIAESAVVATWRSDRIAVVVRNLIWPKLKSHDNFVLPHLDESKQT